MPADGLEKQRWQNEDRLRDHRPPEDKTSNSDLLATHEIGRQVLDYFCKLIIWIPETGAKSFPWMKALMKGFATKKCTFVLISFSRCNVCRRCIRVKNNPQIINPFIASIIHFGEHEPDYHPVGGFLSDNRIVTQVYGASTSAFWKTQLVNISKTPYGGIFFVILVGGIWWNTILWHPSSSQSTDPFQSTLAK